MTEETTTEAPPRITLVDFGGDRVGLKCTETGKFALNTFPTVEAAQEKAQVFEADWSNFRGGFVHDQPLGVGAYANGGR